MIMMMMMRTKMKMMTMMKIIKESRLLSMMERVLGKSVHKIS